MAGSAPFTDLLLCRFQPAVEIRSMVVNVAVKCFMKIIVDDAGHFAGVII